MSWSMKVKGKMRYLLQKCVNFLLKMSMRIKNLCNKKVIKKGVWKIHTPFILISEVLLSERRCLPILEFLKEPV